MGAAAFPPKFVELLETNPEVTAAPGIAGTLPCFLLYGEWVGLLLFPFPLPGP